MCVCAGEPSGDAGEPDGHQGQTRSAVLPGEGDRSRTERVHGLHQEQPGQCDEADRTHAADDRCGGKDLL